MANKIRIKKTDKGYSIRWPHTKKQLDSSSINHNDELTHRSINVTERSIDITNKAIIVTIIATVITIASSVLAVYIFNKSFVDYSDNQIDIKASKENIRNASIQIKNEFKPKMIASSIDIDTNPRIKAFCDFQESVLALVYLQEPHETSHFRSASFNNRVKQVKNNLNSRNEYDHGLKEIMSKIDYITEIEKQDDFNSKKGLDKKYDTRIIDKTILSGYKDLTMSWILNDSERNNKVDDSLQAFRALTGLNESEMNIEFDKVIQPLVIFENDTNNYFFREDLYKYFLIIHGKYMTEIELN